MKATIYIFIELKIACGALARGLTDGYSSLGGSPEGFRKSISLMIIISLTSVFTRPPSTQEHSSTYTLVKGQSEGQFDLGCLNHCKDLYDQSVERFN